MKSLFILAGFIFLPNLALSQTIWNVPGDFPTIQQAIDAAANGDKILVGPGTYLENIKFKGKIITVQSVDGPGVTEINGNQVKSVVTIKDGESRNTILDGFTITNGIGNKIGIGRSGGGIYCEDSDPTFLNNIITGNQANYMGGGIYYQKSSPLIMNNLIEGNDAGNSGGGIGNYDSSSSPTIAGNIIRANSAGSISGGGIICMGNAEVHDNIIKKNTANNGGGLMILGPAIVQNNTIFENQAVSSGGGVFIDTKSNAIFANNYIFRNKANIWGGGLLVMESATLTNNTFCENSAACGGGLAVANSWTILEVVNTILWSNQANQGNAGFLEAGSDLIISYSDVEGGKSNIFEQPGSFCDWGPGMINANPLFVNSANDDFHLTYPSPCKDTGDNSVVTVFTDFEGDPRIAYGTTDMGADEFYTHLYWTGDAVPGGNVELKFIGIPGTAPVYLCFGSGVLDPPLPSMWGDWYLKFPIFGPMYLGSIPSPDGVLIVKAVIPGTPLPPYSIPMQALIEEKLTNLCMMNVE